MISAALKKRLDGYQKPSTAASTSKATSAPSRANRLIIRNLPLDIKEQDISATFLPYGPIHSIDMPKTEDGKPKRFAFVWILSRTDAEKAVAKCNGMKIRAGIADELARAKQKKKKEVRVEKKGRAGEKEVAEDGEEAGGAERVIAVDWALSKDKWEEEKAKIEVDEDTNMDEPAEDGSDDSGNDEDSDEDGDEDEAIGVNEGEGDSDNEELSDGSDEDETKPGKAELPPPETGTTLFVRNLPFEATDEELRLL